MAAASEFPSELSTRPFGLIALTGLDLTQKPLHKAIWESFSVNRRPERVPLSFKLVPIDHEYPKAKPKRTSYEWYIPKGILKTKWMNKHLEQVPALIVVFYELDWDNAQWKEKQNDCAAQVEKVRASIHGRNTKVAVVLIQKNAPLPPGEDMQAAERAAALCSACDLSAKSLFVLPYTDHLFGYAIRLENAFYELAQSYYHGEARKVKAHKEFLNKSTHQLLLVRHQIKVAFFNELRQDPHAAVKHYRQAYTLMSEIKLTDVNVLEVKVVAGYISYKICRLSFQGSAPLDAISQFRKHVDLWKEKRGCSELAFEHSAWLSKQFSLFGDLFDEAIRNGLTALQTQHPGFYYQQAANNAIIRRQLCEGLCHHPSSPISLEPLANAGKLDFYGQRPWRQGFQGAEPLDQPLEHNGILALQAQEMSVDHSWIIIPLLSSAVAQFKKYKSPRMKRYLMVQMGEEYYHARDYSKALMLLGRVTWDYRHERWWSLLTSVLITSLRCAYLVGNVQEYVTISMDLMGKYGLNSPEEKTRVQMNLIHVISNECPEPEPGCDVEAVEEAKEIWKSLAKQTGQVFTVQMDQIAAFVECKAKFDSPSIHADSAIILHIHLRATCPFPIRFSKLSVFFSNQAYNQYCCIDSSQGTDSEGGLYLLPAKTKVIPFKFYPQPEDVRKQLQVSSIALELGSQQGRCAVLVWNGGGTEGTTTLNCFAKHGNSHPDIEDQLDWEALQIASNILINPREPKMEIQLFHDSPTLVNEFFKVTLKVKSLEDTDVKDIRIWFGFQEEHDPSIVDTSTVCLEPPKTGQEAPVQSFVFFNRESMEKEMEQTYYVRCAQVGSRSLQAKITYSVTIPATSDSTPITCVCVKEKKISAKTVMPFDISLSLTSLRLERLDQVSEEEPFLLLASIKCSSPWPVTMVTTRLNLSSEVDFVGEKMNSQLEGVSLQQGESASECYCLAAREGSSSHKVVNIGSLVLEWRRASSPSDCPAVITELTFPSVTVESVPFFINTELPSYGCVQTLMPMSYVIHNRTLQVQEVEVTIEPSESFMFSGQKQVQFRLLPESDHKLSYNLYPLVPGHVTLPKLHLNLPRFQTNWDEHAQKMIPTQVFIKPRAKPVVQVQ